MSGQKAPFGTWNSPIQAAAIAKAANTIADVIVDPATSEVYYLEGRPSAGGRTALVRLSTRTDVVDLGAGWDVRTQVHEYGGGGAIIFNGVAYFSNLPDGRIYRVDAITPGSEPVGVTPANKPYRYACLEQHPTHPDLLAAVLEDHTNDTPQTVVNTLVIIDTSKASGDNLQTLASGTDFYALPKFSPDGRRIAWIQWHHPDMPWEGGELHVADISIATDNTVSVTNDILIAGELSKLSAEYPAWADNDTLVFTLDKSGFVNPWKYAPSQGTSSPLFPTPIKEDFGSPFWQLNLFPYAIIGNEAVLSSIKDGRGVLYRASIQNQGIPQKVVGPSEDFVVVGSFRTIPKESSTVFIGQAVNKTKAIVKLRLTSAGETELTILKGGELLVLDGVPLDPAYISTPNPITLTDPSDNSPLYAVFYAPRNPDYAGSNDPTEKPPCIVNVHGGPTALTEQALSTTTQYFTTRGWAWLDVNYRGSSGYGRDYIQRLNGNWGVLDIQDCVLAPQLLASNPATSDFIDSKRLIIRGGSAGGFTTLASISNAQDVTVYASSTSMYGISNLKNLAADTHKFESRYLDHLMGGNIKDIPEVYDERSPINHATSIVTPLLILQGDLDRVVPKEQSQAMYDTIIRQGGEAEIKIYDGEGHGWRKEETIIDAYERELAFYKKYILK